MCSDVLFDIMIYDYSTDLSITTDYKLIILKVVFYKHKLVQAEIRESLV